MASVCVAAFILAEAGLLHNKRATTHWAFAAELQEKYPDVKVDANPIWIQDGNIYTSAGITAGIDLALAMVEEDHGASVALDVARSLVVFLRRPGGQAQFSVSLSTQASGSKALRDLQVWMAENLNKNLSVDVLARRAAMSPRNFSRVFRKETGITPAKFAERLRVEAARRQLEQTVKAAKEIAASCGFSSSEIMRRTFLSQLQVTPSAIGSVFSAVVHLGQAARSAIDSWIVGLWEIFTSQRVLQVKISFLLFLWISLMSASSAVRPYLHCLVAFAEFTQVIAY